MLLEAYQANIADMAAPQAMLQARATPDQQNAAMILDAIYIGTMTVTSNQKSNFGTKDIADNVAILIIFEQQPILAQQLQRTDLQTILLNLCRDEQQVCDDPDAFMLAHSRRFARLSADEGEISAAIYLDIKKDLQDQNKRAIVVAEQHAAQVRAMLHDQFGTILQHHEIRPFAARLDVRGNNNPQAIARYLHQHAIKELTRDARPLVR